ncbi:MAG: hypothetical protein GXP49_03610 [Deltaproteobacteria bacterium]|nr:hypothetical protein [Deltaproteobacteria bacterium]
MRTVAVFLFCISFLFTGLVPGQVSAGTGTHFALELDGGAAFGLSYDECKPGYTAGASFGLGGRPGGSPLVFYFLTAYKRNNMELDGGQLSLDRTVNSLLFGPRMVLPLFYGLRFFIEGLIGPAWVSSKLRAKSDVSLEQGTETRFAYSLAAGFQYRIIESLSIGIKATYADEYKDEQDPLVLLVNGSGGDPGRRVTTSAFVTFHF